MFLAFWAYPTEIPMKGTGDDLTISLWFYRKIIMMIRNNDYWTQTILSIFYRSLDYTRALFDLNANSYFAK